VDLLALAVECAEDEENKDNTVDVMDYIFRDIFGAMVNRTTMSYAIYIQLLIDNRVVTGDLSQYPRVDYKVKKTYVKRKLAAFAAPTAGSFMGDAHSSGTTHGRLASSPFI
jgi:hypothetical protein